MDHHKTEYYKSKIESADQRQLFRLVDGMIKIKPVSPLLSHTSAHKRTDKFSTYFIEKIVKLLRTPLPKSVMSPKPYLNCSLASLIRKIIEKVPPKSCPSDPIPTRLLKTCLVELRPAITTLINSSLQTVVFPTAFKERRILPKIKKITPDKEDFSNCRPVRNLPSLHKSTLS